MADIIDELLGLDDDGLATKFGYDKQVAQARKDLADAAKLQGEPREKVVTRINEMLTPHVHGSEIRWAVEDAERMAKCDKTDAMNDANPESLAPR